jgi:hypothetical protein
VTAGARRSERWFRPPTGEIRQFDPPGRRGRYNPATTRDEASRGDPTVPRLSNHAIRRILETLDDTDFTAGAFRTEFPESGTTHAEIYFVDGDFHFLLGVSEDKPEPYVVQYIPGEVLRTARHSFSGFAPCIGEIRKWANNIRHELIAAHPLYSEFEELKKAVNETVDRKFKDATETFSSEELADLQAKLDELFGKFQELADSSAITAEELASLKETVDALKRDAAHFPKKTWYRAAGNGLLKLLSSIVKSKPAQKILEQGTRKLLGMSEQ